MLIVMRVLPLFKSSSNRGLITTPIEAFGGSESLKIIAIVEIGSDESHVIARVQRKGWNFFTFRLYLCFRVEKIFKRQKRWRNLET